MKKYVVHYRKNDEGKIVETNLDQFFKELFSLYEKYDVSISHEDSHGAFMLDHDNEYNRDWIKEAGICRWLDKYGRDRGNDSYSLQIS